MEEDGKLTNACDSVSSKGPANVILIAVDDRTRRFSDIPLLQIANPLKGTNAKALTKSSDGKRTKSNISRMTLHFEYQW